MIFSATDTIQLVMFIISLSVFVLNPDTLILKYYPVYFLGGLALSMYQEFTSNRGIYNTGVVNAYNIADFSFVYLVLREFIDNIKIRRIILFAITIFAPFAIIDLICIQKKVGFNPFNFTIECLITVILCICYFVELFQKEESPSLSELPAFWITSAIFFNTILTFPMFGLISFIQELTKLNQRSSGINFNNVSAIYNIIIILTYALYSIGFLCRIRIRKSSL
jgi:hypothetical protein